MRVPGMSTALRGLTKMPCRIRPSSKKTVRTNSKVSTSCGPYAVSTRACHAVYICTLAAAGLLRRTISQCSVWQSKSMDGELRNRIQKIDGLIAQIRSGTDPRLRDAALDLMQTVMEFHSAGIDRMMEIASETGETGWRIIDDFGRDELVANMLLLHGLHPVDL